MCVRRHLRLDYVMGLRILGLNLLCLDRNRHGGGVAMYTSMKNIFQKCRRM